MADEPTIHSLLGAVEDGDPIPANDDETLAQELQLQELLVVISPPSIASFGRQDTVIEQGETSGTKSDEFDCNICMETKELTEQFTIEGCPHAFCNSCMSQYIAAQVEANVATVKCPDPQCKVSTAPALHPDTCRSILPEAVFDRWGMVLCESALGPSKFYCPFTDCSALVVKEEEDVEMTDAVCPHCERELCATCRVAWHVGVNCEEFRRLDEGERGREDLLLMDLAKNSKWQRCPECKVYVERIAGCRCGHFFCYDCASPMQQNNHSLGKVRHKGLITVPGHQSFLEDIPMDDLIDTYSQSSKWSDGNASSRAQWNGSGISLTNGLLANSVEEYKEMNVQGHDGTPSILADGSMKYEILDNLYPTGRLPDQELHHQFSNSVLMNNGAQVGSFSEPGITVNTTATTSFQSSLPLSTLVISSSIESNNSELSLFPDSLGEAHSITSVPTIWPSMYSSVSSIFEQENMPAFSYQGNENNDDMLRKMSFDNRSSFLGRLPDASLPVKDRNDLHDLSFSVGQQEQNGLHSSFPPEPYMMALKKTAQISSTLQTLPSEGHTTSQINSSTQSQVIPANGSGCNGAAKPRVRARRGQATDPHSIAERLRREKIAERMKNLQELVPNSNKSDKASMLDDIIDYVKFLQLQVKVLSMSRLGATGAVVPLLTDTQTQGSSSLLLSSSEGQGGADISGLDDSIAFEQEVVKLMETNVTSAMQLLQNKGLCLLPVGLATAISTNKGTSTAVSPDTRKLMIRHSSTVSGCDGTLVKEEAHQLDDKARLSDCKPN
ncbi:hypothetical protein ZIOFF_019887 [Zingiber officinale]|uniref:RBR-type E3 ubiquitin transferase n=1 Tax=Zingiber officinale TaxID=94328 RepID=A0A8J5LJK6_ZINOF|nr:hypothetical protein ZIOFF_019887 [Zingiber officinale]